MLTAAILLSTMLSGPEFPASPLATVWDRRQYGAESGNWAITQDSAGIMYFGNNLGVLKYDGSRFRLIPLPNSGAVRSLLYHDNRVFVGGQDEFGYLAPGETGYTEYVSLAASLPEGWRRFADVWSLHALETGILFQTPEALFVYDGQETRRFETALGRGPLVSAGKYGLLRIDGKRLVRVHPDGETEPLAQHPNWREQRLVAATEEEDGLALITTGFTNRAAPFHPIQSDGPP